MDFTSGILSVTGINATGHIFASYPARHLSVLGGFIDQVSSDLRDLLTSALCRTALLQSSHSGPKYPKVWQTWLMRHWSAQLAWEQPPRLLTFASNDPLPGEFIRGLDPCSTSFSFVFVEHSDLTLRLLRWYYIKTGEVLSWGLISLIHGGIFYVWSSFVLIDVSESRFDQFYKPK